MGHMTVAIDGHSLRSLNAAWGDRPEPFWHDELAFAARYREHHGDALPDSTFWHWLEYRRSIDPPRFDHWHPTVGRWIAEVPEGQEIGPPPVIPPPPIAGGGTAEPGSGVLLVIAIVAATVGLRVVRIVSTWRNAP